MTSILHLGKFYPPEWGGTEQVTQTLANGSATHGMATSVIAFTKHNESDELLDGVEVHRRKTNAILSSQPLSISWLWTAIRKIRKFDIVLIHSPNFLAVLALFVMSRRQRLVTYWHMDVVGKKVLKALVTPLQSFMLRRSDVVMVSSQQYADSSPALQPFLDKVKVVSIGIADPVKDAKAGVPIPESIAAFARGRPIALAIGRLVPYKGFDQLVMSAKYSGPEIAIVVVGDGPMRSALLALVQEHGVEDRILFAGRQLADDLAALLCHARLYVMPSNIRTEAFGVVQLEAMSHSLPIVVTDLPGSGVAWVADFGNLGAMVPVNDPKALGDAVRDVATSPDHDRLAASSRARFERYFTETTMITCFLKELDELH